MMVANLQIHDGTAEERDGEEDRAGATKYPSPAVAVEEACQKDGPAGAPT